MWDCEKLEEWEWEIGSKCAILMYDLADMIPGIKNNLLHQLYECKFMNVCMYYHQYHALTHKCIVSFFMDNRFKLKLQKIKIYLYQFKNVYFIYFIYNIFIILYLFLYLYSLIFPNNTAPM